jgi:hypothetical protein
VLSRAGLEVRSIWPWTIASALAHARANDPLGNGGGLVAQAWCALLPQRSRIQGAVPARGVLADAVAIPGRTVTATAGSLCRVGSTRPLNAT